jgi:hypothetical protein
MRDLKYWAWFGSGAAVVALRTAECRTYLEDLFSLGALESRLLQAL